MKTIIAITALVATVGTASANATVNEVSRYATPNTIAKLTGPELREANSFISSGASASEIRTFIQVLAE